MSKLLTKEQVELALKTIKDVVLWQPIIDVEGVPYTAGVTYEDLERALERCTEKEFPRFNLYDEEKCLILEVRQQPDSWIAIDTGCYKFAISPEKFARFALNCNKILQWLEEQE